MQEVEEHDVATLLLAILESYNPTDEGLTIRNSPIHVTPNRPTPNFLLG